MKMPLSKHARKKASISTIFILVISLLTGLNVTSNGRVYFSLESLLIPFWAIPVLLLISYLLLAVFIDWLWKQKEDTNE